MSDEDNNPMRVDVTQAHDIKRNPAEIWLSPICDDIAHHGEGRSWASPAPDTTCEDCTEPWVRYVREDLAHTARPDATINGLEPKPGHGDGCGAHDDYRCDCTARPDAGDEQAEIERLRQALEDVVNPIGVLKRYAEAEGAKLSGAAYSIANDIGYVQGIARDALAATPAPRTDAGDFERVAKALYEHWAEQHVGLIEWTVWDKLPDKQVWFERARAALAAMRSDS